MKSRALTFYPMNKLDGSSSIRNDIKCENVVPSTIKPGNFELGSDGPVGQNKANASFDATLKRS